MKHTTIRALLILSLALTLSGLIYESSSQTFQVLQLDPFQVLLSEDSTVAFQSENHVVLVTAESNMNGSDCTIWISDSGGSFRFTPENSTDIEVTLIDVSICKINGELVENRSDWTLAGSSRYDLTWGYMTQFMLPIRPILGIASLILLFGSSLYAVDRIKKHDYIVGLKFGVVFGALGIALFIIWLWG